MNLLRKPAEILKEFLDGPSLGSMAASLRDAVVAFANQGLPVPPPQIRQDRLTICQACEAFLPGTSRCRECGCFLPAKVAMATEACPLGKWGAVTGPSGAGGCGCGEPNGGGEGV